MSELAVPGGKLKKVVVVDSKAKNKPISMLFQPAPSLRPAAK